MEGLADVPFGRAMRHQEYALARNKVTVNDGSFGAVPNRVRKAQEKLFLEIEGFPDVWFRSNALKLWTHSIAVVAKFVKANPDNLVFVQNDTTAINTVLNSLQLKSDEGILVASTTYIAITKTCKHIVEKAKGAKLYLMEIAYPVAREYDIVSQYDAFLADHPDVRVVIIDHISSDSALRFPVRRLVNIIHKYDALALVDGAHAPGHIDLNLEEIGADFYTGNLYKWCYAVRGSSFLWVHPKHQNKITPLVISHNYNKGFSLEFFKQGTNDYTPYFCAETAFQFYDAIGGIHKISAYNTDLLKRVVPKLAKKWGTTIPHVPKEMEAPFMKLVGLPDLGCEKNTDASDAFTMRLLVEHNLAMQIVCVQGKLYARLTAQVYNTEEDYEYAGEVVQTLVLRQKEKTQMNSDDSRQNIA